MTWSRSFAQIRPLALSYRAVSALASCRSTLILSTRLRRAPGLEALSDDELSQIAEHLTLEAFPRAAPCIAQATRQRALHNREWYRSNPAGRRFCRSKRRRSARAYGTRFRKRPSGNSRCLLRYPGMAPEHRRLRRHYRSVSRPANQPQQGLAHPPEYSRQKPRNRTSASSPDLHGSGCQRPSGHGRSAAADAMSQHARSSTSKATPATPST